MEILHPRYPLIPKVGMTMTPRLMALWVKPTVQRIIREGYDFDLIDAHYFYPDGVAAAMIGRSLGKPVVITARGTDINLIPQNPTARKQILWAAQQAKGMITVCQALKDEMVQLGVDADRITTLRNGVDLKLFRPGDRSGLRRKLGLEDFTLLSVGHLIERKGHDLIIRAMPALPDARLLIAGAGPEEEALKALVTQLGVVDRVEFLGALPQETLRQYYAAVDALVLASSREGWANVLLESMACGTPVVASNVWGTPEVVASQEAGVLMKERTPEGIVEAVNKLRASRLDHAATRRYAEKFSWDDTTQGQLRLFREILAEQGA